MCPSGDMFRVQAALPIRMHACPFSGPSLPIPSSVHVGNPRQATRVLRPRRQRTKLALKPCYRIGRSQSRNLKPIGARARSQHHFPLSPPSHVRICASTAAYNFHNGVRCHVQGFRRPEPAGRGPDRWPGEGDPFLCPHLLRRLFRRIGALMFSIHALRAAARRLGWSRAMAALVSAVSTPASQA